jgi:GGDEF domain-containing protein
VQGALDAAARPAVLVVDLDPVDGLPARHDTRRAALDIAVEARVARATRPNDSVGRLEPDRYAVLARESHGAEGIAERLAERLREPFEIGGEEMRVEVSVAVVVADLERTAAELMERALAGR